MEVTDMTLAYSFFRFVFLISFLFCSCLEFYTFLVIKTAKRKALSCSLNGLRMAQSIIGFVAFAAFFEQVGSHLLLHFHSETQASRLPVFFTAREIQPSHIQILVEHFIFMLSLIAGIMPASPLTITIFPLVTLLSETSAVISATI